VWYPRFFPSSLTTMASFHGVHNSWKTDGSRWILGKRRLPFLCSMRTSFFSIISSFSRIRVSCVGPRSLSRKEILAGGGCWWRSSGFLVEAWGFWLLIAEKTNSVIVDQKIWRSLFRDCLIHSKWAFETWSVNFLFTIT